MRLHLESFTLRGDDSERMVDVAYGKVGVGQFRFAAPMVGGYGREFSSQSRPLDIETRVQAAECQKGAHFKPWADENDHLRVKFVNYLD
jgi:hypothetical protein